MCAQSSFLQLRKHGYVWRRRVPRRGRQLFTRPFLCFALRTHVLCEAAEIGRRLTALAELCFNAETAVPPEVMTQLLTSYARFEIETADRLRALTGRRSRAAAEAAMAIEAATRASLRDAIFLCDHQIAAAPIQDTCERLGLRVDVADEDYAILAERMIRLMIEVSAERERRARGTFSEPQPYLRQALDGISTLPESASAPTPAMPAILAPQIEPVTAPEAQATCTANSVIPTAGSPIVDSDELTVRLADPDRPDSSLPTTLLAIWDNWFAARMRGETRSGAYVYNDAGKAERFARDADTTLATRKLIADLLGDREIMEISARDWADFNDNVRRIPANHGKSPKDRDKSYAQIISHADREEARRLRRVDADIVKNTLSGDAAEKMRRQAVIARLSPRTLQRHQKYLCAPLDHAVAQGLISANPYKPYVLGERAITELRKAAPDTSRKLWHQEFSDLIATRKWQDLETQIADPIYWAPLIARLSGLRSEEILQLTPANIRQDGDIFYFEVERGTGQSVKSANGRRMIPVHSRLLELGFLNLVAQQTRLGKTRIFDTVSRSKSQKKTYTANFTKNFNYYRHSCGVYSARHDMHGLRTTFHSALIERGIPDTARRYLMGHRNDDVGIINYLPEGFPMKTLSEYVETIRIDMSPVKKRFGDAPTVSGPRLVVSNRPLLTR